MLRIGLVVLAASELALAFWTALFPESFYSNVPTGDRTPPYSEHLFGTSAARRSASRWC
jgi:hypothetical protein